jgi:hypothetical protein
MSRKKRRRKVWALIDPIAHAIAGAAITDTASLDKLRMLELSAIEAFSKGHATADDWRALADMLNICETMAAMGIGPEALETCRQAQEALGHAHARHKAGRALLFTGPELNVLRDSFGYHDLQRSSISRSQYEQAITKTANRIKSAHPSLKVFA